MGNGEYSLGFSVSACAVVMAASLGGPAVVNSAEADAAQAVERYCNARSGHQPDDRFRPTRRSSRPILRCAANGRLSLAVMSLSAVSTNE